MFSSVSCIFGTICFRQSSRSRVKSRHARQITVAFLFVGEITVDGAEGKSRNNDVRRVRRVAQLPSPALGCCLLFLFHLLYELYLYDMMHAVRV